jgi:hypothetical protein
MMRSWRNSLPSGAPTALPDARQRVAPAIPSNFLAPPLTMHGQGRS